MTETRDKIIRMLLVALAVSLAFNAYLMIQVNDLIRMAREWKDIAFEERADHKKTLDDWESHQKRMGKSLDELMRGKPPREK